MKRAIIILAVLVFLVTGVYTAGAETLARDAMMTYTGTEAFTKLTSMERQACVDWLVYGGEMSEKCSKAVKKLVSYDPDAVTPEQRQALIAEASGYSETVPEYTPTRTETPPQVTKQEDNTGKYIAVGLLGVLAGLIIHNNVGHSSSSPSYEPEYPRYHRGKHSPPDIDRRPPDRKHTEPRYREDRHPDRRPPERHTQPPRRENRTPDRRPSLKYKEVKNIGPAPH